MSKPIYTTFESVKVRLANKVQFQQDPENLLDGELPNALLAQLISDAETTVEMDLRFRYAIPFQSITTGRFCDLPDHTQRAIRVAVDLKSVLNVLGTDFGQGSHISMDGYKKDQEERYENQINLILGRDKMAANGKIDRFQFGPPLEGLKLAQSNSKADDGYRGMIINTDASTHGAESYAAEQINNPSQSILRRRGWGGI